MRNEKRKHSAEFKVEFLREHLENQVPVRKICEQYNINPNLFYLWEKELFNVALETFSKKKTSKSEEEKIARLEEKLKDKDSLISEIVEDNLRLKKSEWGVLSNMWVKLEIRDSVVQHVGYLSLRSCIPVKKLLTYIGLCRVKYYKWVKGAGKPNFHNVKIPKIS